MITAQQFAAIFPNARHKAGIWLQPLNDAMAEFQINNTGRIASFLAQVAHETGELVWIQEIASGAAYEGRADLGNTQPGDGKRYKGRGLLQITGRANYKACGDALGLPLEDQPELLLDPVNACRSAGWFWTVGAGLRLSMAAK